MVPTPPLTSPSCSIPTPDKDIDSPFSVLSYSSYSRYRCPILRPILFLLLQIQILDSPLYPTSPTSGTDSPFSVLSYSSNSRYRYSILRPPLLILIKLFHASISTKDTDFFILCILSLSLVLPTQILLSHFYLNIDIR